MNASIHILIKVDTEPETEVSAIYHFVIKDEVLIERIKSAVDYEPDFVDKYIIGQIFNLRNEK